MDRQLTDYLAIAYRAWTMA